MKSMLLNVISSIKYLFFNNLVYDMEYKKNTLLMPTTLMSCSITQITYLGARRGQWMTVAASSGESEAPHVLDNFPYPARAA